MNVDEFLKSDRQWPHRCRVSYARAQLDRANTRDEIEFWKAVLKANDKGKIV